MAGFFQIALLCCFAEFMIAAAMKPCCISKRWNGTMRITRATVSPGSVIPVITVNDLDFNYDKDRMMERARGSIKTENGTMVTKDGYVVYNDYRNMKRYVLDESGKCHHEKVTSDQVSNCLPGTATFEKSFTLGSSSEGVMVNSWLYSDGQASVNMLTTVNDCTPISMSRFGSMPDGTSFTEDTVYVDVHQYMTSPDAFMIPAVCNDDAVIPVGK